MDNQLWQFAGSLLAVTALVGLAHLLGFSRAVRLSDKQEAATIARLTPGGFEPLDIALDVDGRGALARDADGAFVVIAAHGGQFIPHSLDRGSSVAIDAEIDGPRIALTLPSGCRVMLETATPVGDWLTNSSPHEGAAA